MQELLQRETSALYQSLERAGNPLPILTQLLFIVVFHELLDVFEQFMDQLYLSLVIFTGMRRGEVLGLRWEDVDLAENTIHVQRNATYTNNQPFVGTPKTKSGFREVPIIPDLLSFLLPVGEKGFVVSQKDPEKPLTLTAFRCMMKRINASVDLHGATSHVFRHTIGTMLNDTGADVKTIQSILGQSDFKTTMDRYVHPRDNKKQEAIKNVSLLLQG